MNSVIPRVALSAPVAVALSMLIAGTALGHTWSGAQAITSSGKGFAHGVVGLDSSSGEMVYEDWNGTAYSVIVEHTGDSGSTWKYPITLSTNGAESAIRGLYPYVDVVWEEGGAVLYKRSPDTGITYYSTVNLTPGGGSPINLSVATGPNHIVAVAWQDEVTKAVSVKVSYDGGFTFVAPATFPSTVLGMGTSVAVGNGVVYLAYKTTGAKLRVRRSVDNGFTWGASTKINDNGIGTYGQFSIAADGSNAYLAYEVKNPTYPGYGALRYKRTVNSGIAWSSEFVLGKNAWKTDTPRLSLQSGILRVVFDRRVSTGLGVHYRQSADGLNWSAAEPVSSSGRAAFVTYAGKILVQYELGSGNAYLRRGS